MAAEQVTAILDVFRVDPQTEAETRVGQVEYSESGRLALLDVEPEHDARLRSAITAVNGKTDLVELVPPTGSDTPFATASKVTQRSDADFMQALNRYMLKYYGFSLG